MHKRGLCTSKPKKPVPAALQYANKVGKAAVLLEFPDTPRRMLSAEAAKKFYTLPDEERLVLEIRAAGFAAHRTGNVQLNVLVARSVQIRCAAECSPDRYHGCSSLCRFFLRRIGSCNFLEYVLLKSTQLEIKKDIRVQFWNLKCFGF